ncbi:dTMP kinase [uncultured Amnibacterium sp.]|uniref:dTMP kinase n=1 Tax=uncultured Amnibacterium sp. TaxID=1631851 RepID=UPI0035C9FB56
MTGAFVTFEGGDAVGKSTQAAALQAWLQQQGHDVVRTREPGGTPLGEAVRELVLHREWAVAPRAEALLYAADRAQHVATVVRPALARGAVVIQDRYLDSSVAYQGSGRVLDPSEVRRLSLWATEDLLPDLTVLLDLPAEAARARRTGRGYDRLEAEEDAFHERVRLSFLRLADAEPDRFLVLDGAQPTDVLSGLVRDAVAPLVAPLLS